MDNLSAKVRLTVEHNVDIAIEKAEQLERLLIECTRLIQDLNAMNIDIDFNITTNGEAD